MKDELHHKRQLTLISCALTIGASLICQNCITSPSYYTQCMVLHSMHHIIKNAFINAAVLCWRYKLHHRGCITSSTLYYIFNAALNHTLHYVIEAVLHDQRYIAPITMNYIVNPSWHCQCCIKKWTRCLAAHENFIQFTNSTLSGALSKLSWCEVSY